VEGNLTKSALKDMPVEELRTMITEVFDPPDGLDFSIMVKDELVTFGFENLEDLNEALNGVGEIGEVVEDEQTLEKGEDWFLDSEESKTPNISTDLG